MKKFLPYILVAVLIAALFFSMRGCVKRTVMEHAILQGAATAPDSGRIWKDAYGREHRRTLAAIGERRVIELAYGTLLDSIGRLNKVSTNQIDQITWLSTELTGARTIAVVNTHQEGYTNVNFNYADAWLRLNGTGSIYADSLGAIRLDYTLRDSLIITTLRQRTGLFRKCTFVDVTSANPDIHISGVHVLQVRDRPKRWGIGLQAGVTYNSRSWMPYLGIGLSYNLIRF